MLIGSDELHEVVVENSKQGWFRHVSESDKQSIANPAVGDFLDKGLAE
jgi:hypothetical protein